MTVVNLNKFRKKKQRKEREKRAETNRRLHGRTNAERAREALAKQRLDAKFEQARLSAKPSSADSRAEEPEDER